METNRLRPHEPCRHRFAIHACLPLLVVGVWLTGAPWARAQTGETAVPAAVASVLDGQTVAIVGIDTNRFDLDAAVLQVSAIPILTERQRGDLALHKKNLANWLKLFHQAGGRDLWIVLTLADELANVPFVVVPLHEGADRQALEGLFVAGKQTGPRGTDYPFIVSGSLERDGGLIFGSDSTLKRLREFSGPLRTIPNEALGAVAGAEIRAFVIPTDDQRRVLSEFLRDPQAERAIAEHMPPGVVPPEFLRNPGEIARLALSDGLQWIAAGITSHEALAATLVIGSKDAVSAQALALWIGGAWQFAKEHVAAEKTPESAMISALIDQFSHLLAPKVEGNRLTMRVDLKGLTGSAAGAFLGQATLGAMKRTELNVVKNHLKQLALALHNYHDVNQHFPPAAIRDAQGRPLLSWRVMLLPYLEEGKLYKQFHLDEPWDSEHNKPLIAKMPDVFTPRSIRLRAEGKTTLLVPVGKQTIFGPKDGVPIRDITDGTSTTILIVDADEGQAVVWTRPDDLNVDGIDARQALFGTRKDGVSCDGRRLVRFLRTAIRHEDSYTPCSLAMEANRSPWPENR